MIELLIQAVDGDFLILTPDGLTQAFDLRDQGWEPVPGWGEVRLARGDALLTVTTEPPGLQVSLEGVTQEDAVALAHHAAARVTTIEGRPTQVVQIT